MAAGWCLNQVLTGNLPQPPCTGSSSVNKTYFTLVYCSYSSAEFCRLSVLQLGCGPGHQNCSTEVGFQAKAWFQVIRSFLPILRHHYIIITCYGSNNGSATTYHCVILHHYNVLINPLLPTIYCNNETIIKF